MSTPACKTCGGTFELGEDAYAEDVKRIDLSDGSVHVVTRYTHIACIT